MCNEEYVCSVGQVCSVGDEGLAAVVRVCV